MPTDEVLCLRCNSTMDMQGRPYALPLEQVRKDNDQTRIDLTEVISVMVLRCSNESCRTIELRSPYALALRKSGASNPG